MTVPSSPGSAGQERMHAMQQTYDEQAATLEDLLRDSRQQLEEKDRALNTLTDQMALMSSGQPAAPNQNSNDELVSDLEARVSELSALFSGTELLNGQLQEEISSLRDIKQLTHQTEFESARELFLMDLFTALDLDGSGFVQSDDLMQLATARKTSRQQQFSNESLTRAKMMLEWSEAKNQNLDNRLVEDSNNGQVGLHQFIGGFNTHGPKEMIEFAAVVGEYHRAGRWLRGEQYELKINQLLDEAVRGMGGVSLTPGRTRWNSPSMQRGGGELTMSHYGINFSVSLWRLAVSVSHIGLTLTVSQTLNLVQKATCD